MLQSSSLIVANLPNGARATIQKARTANRRHSCCDLKMARKQSNGKNAEKENDQSCESECSDHEPGASDGEQEPFDADAAAAAEATTALVRQRDLLFQWHIARDGRDVRFSEYKMDKDGNALVTMNTREGDLTIPIPKENLHHKAILMSDQSYKLDDSQSLKMTGTLAFEKHLRALLRATTKPKKASGVKRTRAKKPSKESAAASGTEKESSTS